MHKQTGSRSVIVRAMPRTVNVQVHKVRRDAFLDVAQRLIQAKGYEQMSIQDVLDELETSRGALYHYFDSKEALLDGVVERFADFGMAVVAPILADPNLPALRKLEKVLGGIATYKAEHRELVLAIMDVWNSDGNVLVREKLRRLSAPRLEPILSTVIRQGIDEGIIQSDAPEEMARVIVYLMQGYGDLAAGYFTARQAGTLSLDDVLRTYAAFTQAFERILGIPPGSVTLTDEQTLRYWFG
jgi:AcrR family transcriptional regulator